MKTMKTDFSKAMKGDDFNVRNNRHSDRHCRQDRQINEVRRCHEKTGCEILRIPRHFETDTQKEGDEFMFSILGFMARAVAEATLKEKVIETVALTAATTATAIAVEKVMDSSRNKEGAEEQ